MGSGDAEIAAAVLGGGIATVTAVLLFVGERIVSRRAAYTERRRLAFDEVILAFAAYVAASMESGQKPEPAIAASLVTARARMTLALRVDDRLLGWWVNGMEGRLVEAVNQLPTSGPDRFARVEAVNSNLVNTLIDLHTGRMNNRDMIGAAAIFWAETSRGVDIRNEKPDEWAAAERPRRRPENHGIVAWCGRQAAHMVLRVRKIRGKDTGETESDAPEA